MIIEDMKQGSGITTRALQLAKEHDAVLVVYDDIGYVLGLMQQMKVKGVKVVTYRQVMTLRWNLNQKLVIDGVETFKQLRFRDDLPFIAVVGDFSCESKELDLANELVKAEMSKATIIHGKFNSRHEVYGVLAEEINEVFTEVCGKDFDRWKLADELKQVAAVAQRALAQIIAGELVK